MATEEQLVSLKSQPAADEDQIRKSRITAILLGTTTLITLVFLVFAFTQKEVADRALKELRQTQWNFKSAGRQNEPDRCEFVLLIFVFSSALHAIYIFGPLTA